MRLRKTLFILVVIMATGCGEKQETATDTAHVPFVKMATLAFADGNALTLSGVVRARHETPLAFQVNGQITARWVDAGEVVRAGEPLFELDPRDLKQGAQAAQANVSAAEVALAIAQADLERMQQLKTEKFISAQTLDRAELNKREAETRLEAAQANLAQALNRLGYSRLVAPAAGVLIEATGEPGQIVAAGQSVAVFASEGAREIELFFPDASKPPPTGRLLSAQGLTIPLRLREVSGAVDTHSRTWRARYYVVDNDQVLALGSVVRAEFEMADDDEVSFEIPITALDERGDGPVLWQVIDGRAQSFEIEVLSIGTETAKVRGALNVGDEVIALGTHLLTPNMAVQKLNR